MSAKYIGHEEVLQVHKSLSRAGFVTSKAFNQPEWTLFVATGSEPGQTSANMNMVGSLVSSRRMYDDFFSFGELILHFVEKATDRVSFRDRWHNNFVDTTKKFPLFNHTMNKHLSAEKVLPEVDVLREYLKQYSSYMKLPSELSRKGEATRNRHILPFFLAGDFPDLCETALNLGIEAASPVAAALRSGKISCEEAEEYAAMPKEWAASLLF